ncbi:DNA repair protein RAD2 [Kluyveromyces marxianus]|uniref:DNA repair protein RAD2 n=1 Tax=Kluyveromyces marxianus TaxID=4911 RepID=A0ABX6ES61_KLUMA|nr:DNA repair protein RAD2 [Kluyveromyces marxianus]
MIFLFKAMCNIESLYASLLHSKLAHRKNISTPKKASSTRSPSLTMGVHSLWDIVSPTAKPVRLESLNERRMAVDASIWIYQFLTAMRNKEGDALRNAHIIGFFRRICKLLYYGIKPVFVFDGGVPVLKLNTIRERKERRQGKRDSANATARRLLAKQIHQSQVEKEASPKKKNENKSDEVSSKNQPFYPHDEYHLPDIKGFSYEKGDMRITDSEDYKTVMDQIDDLDGIDLDTVNPASKEFDELPKSTQYLILSALRLKSRLRLGYTKEQLEQVFPDSMEFSKFQIEMVKRRNFFTQKLMNVTGMHDGGASKLNEEVVNRVAGQRDRQYALIRTENGWALSLAQNDGSESAKAIKLEDDDDNDDDDEAENLDWEEVDTKPKPKKKELDYSINASLLPRLSSTKMQGGSQSFLDKRPDLAPTTSHLLDEDGEKNSEEEDDYVQLLKETRAMAQYQESQSRLKEQPPIQVNLESSEAESESESDGEFEDVNFKPTSIPPNIRPSTESSKDLEPISGGSGAGDGAEPPLTHSTKSSAIPVLDNQESRKDLENIVNKIPQFSFSLNVKGKAFENEKPSEEPPIAPAEKKSKGKSTDAPVPEVPAWFSSSTNDNPYNQSSFVTDREPSNSKTDENYGLLTGEAAQELVRNRARFHQEVVELNDESDSDSNSDKEEVIEIQNPEREVKETSAPKTDAGSQPESESDSDSAPVSDSDSEVVREQLPLLDYDFYEDEEERLAEQLTKEQEDYNQFKSALNPNVVQNAFLDDDEIYEQQRKDKRDADEVTVEMIHEIQSLLSRFGIPYITAPMEAEAQCATLLQLKLVDGIITDDSDVFLFGGTHVYKNMFQEKNYVEYYSLDLLDQKLGLDRDKLIQLAQLLGSDYTAGLKGIGPVMGVEILAEFGSLKEFAKWYNEGQFDKQKLENETTFQKQLRKRLVKNDIVLDENFPSAAVYDAYIHPTVDSDKTKFVWGSPDLDKLRSFLQQTIGWNREKSDEVLVPLIRDLNKRKSTGVQKRINEFFPVQYLQQEKQYKLGKRIETATSKLKKRRLK